MQERRSARYDKRHARKYAYVAQYSRFSSAYQYKNDRMR